MLIHVVNISGGKDSTATALMCRATCEGQDIRYVTADTDNEHQITYDYINYLQDYFGQEIVRLRNNFALRIAAKRKYVAEHWPAEGVDPEIVQTALDALRATDNAFLDLCIWKGRFPSRRAQFCTTELKTNLLVEYQLDLLDAGHAVWSWQGVRRDESLNRRYLPEFEEVGAGLYINRPIARWKAESCFEAMAYMGVKPNPLYTMGMRRVGCMPCINANKDEIANIDKRWPEVINRIEAWEDAVNRASKRQGASFFPAPADGRGDLRGRNIRDYVQWAKTSYGGRQYDLLKAGEALACSSAYGLCE